MLDLGTILDICCTSRMEVRLRIKQARSTFNAMRNLLTRGTINIVLRLRLFRCCIINSVLWVRKLDVGYITWGTSGTLSGVYLRMHSKNIVFLKNFQYRSPQQTVKKIGWDCVAVHMTIGSNVKRLWVAVSVKKIWLKCQNFRITISSNYSKNLGKISFKIFAQNWLLYMIIFRTFTWNFWLHSCS